MRKFEGAFLISILVGSAGCTNSFLGHATAGNESLSSSSTAVPQKKSIYDVNRYAVNKTVCNPLGGSGTPANTPTQGVHATLTYLTAGQPLYQDVADIINLGQTSPQDLFFTEINVPTRLFTEGFPNQTGSTIKDDQGNPLLENFALRFSSNLHLAPTDVDGDYQFGLLSDDGAILSFSNDGATGFQTIVGNDGYHPTKMGCGSTVSMTSTSNFEMQLDYFQGPRWEIALVPLYRLVNKSTPPEALCGQYGNQTFFDPYNNSNPLTNYMSLLADGWRPLTAANYSVTSATAYNPCVTGTDPVVTNVAIQNNLELGYFLVTWTTDIEATDQVLVTDTATNAETLTTSDNVLRTQHSVKVQGVMFANHTYTIQTVSISADLGKTVSPAITVQVN